MTKCEILSQSYAPFMDRADAGRVLARELEVRGVFHPVVLGIPRGGMVVARELASALGGELDVIMTHKIGAPGHPELAVGAVTESGKIFLDRTELLTGDAAYLEAEKTRQYKLLTERLRLYREILPKTALTKRVVVVTDDGVATGFTMRAALWAARQEHPRELIVAIPVGVEEAVKELAGHADTTLCLRAPAFFAGVSQFYVSFDEVQDLQLLELMKIEQLRVSSSFRQR